MRIPLPCSRFRPLPLGLAPLAAPAASQVPAPFDELTNTYRRVANFNIETTRGLHYAASGRILMLDTHGSTLDVILPGGPLEPDFHWPTLNNLIAFDVFVDALAEPDAECAVVLGGGTHALALHDLDTGRILRTLQLAAEPGDVVVDSQNRRGFASVPGNNTVVQFSLPNLRLTATFTVAGQRPRFLSFDGGDPASAADNTVFVVPELSGNNTASRNALNEPGTASFPEGAPSTEAKDVKPSSPAACPTRTCSAPTPTRVRRRPRPRRWSPYRSCATRARCSSPADATRRPASTGCSTSSR